MHDRPDTANAFVRDVENQQFGQVARLFQPLLAPILQAALGVLAWLFLRGRLSGLFWTGHLATPDVFPAFVPAPVTNAPRQRGAQRSGCECRPQCSWL